MLQAGYYCACAAVQSRPASRFQFTPHFTRAAELRFLRARTPPAAVPSIQPCDSPRHTPRLRGEPEPRTRGPIIVLMIASINPATGELLRTFDPLDDAGIDDRLERAERAWQSYRRTTHADRARWLSAAAEILEAERDRLGRIMTLEMGKPIGA